MLAEHPREVVEREELLRRVWGSRAAVSDEPLTRCIAELRRAFGDSRQTPTYVQTIPKRGYRLLSPGRSARRRAATGGDDRLAAACGSCAARRAPTCAHRCPRCWARSSRQLSPGCCYAGTPREAARRTTCDRREYDRRVAVRRYERRSESAYLGEGLADEILSRLSSVEGLRVVARTSSFSFRDSTDDVRDIAERLRVAHVLEGSVRRSGESVRVSAQLIDARRGYQLWAASYDGVLDDIFALQDEIANALVLKLRETVTTVPPGIPITTPAPTDEPRCL